MAARAQRVMLRVVVSIIVAVCVVVGAFWLYAVVTGGRYM
jgi:heme/copper-type cytochrome/quinol oxidase subunit 4